jgi:60 kDa SS-A/Ro ribonucleoprotein
VPFGRVAVLCSYVVVLEGAEMSKYLKTAAKAVATPPQSQPLDERQVANSAGGYAYPVDEWKRLDRFLILGSEGGSYYATEQKLTKENIEAIKECVKLDGLRAVKRIVEISDAGRAPKNDPALLALAYASAKGDNATRAAALDALPKVARIGTHLFHFVDFVTEFRGWGRGLKGAVANWYLNQKVERLADQVTKYQQRDGMSQRDLLRLTHVKPKSDELQAIFKWVVKGEVSENLPERIQGHVALQAASTAKEAAALIRKYGLVRESVPTELLKEKEVWEALLEKMPITAMIRNLGNLSKCGLLIPMSEASKQVAKVLGDTEVLKRGRVHPIQILMAQKVYASGQGMRGSGTWAPVPKVVDALDGAFYEAFNLVEPTGKRYYLGLDISGSMYGGVVAGCAGLTPAVASGAMAMVTVKTEEEYYAAGFTMANNKGGYGGRWGGGNSAMSPLALSPKQRLDDVVKLMEKMSEKMGGTDCALPMLDATEKKLKVDVFCVYTDSETWAGDVHPVQALQKYRDKMGIPAKLVVVGMVANPFSIADPNDGGMLDVVGFDTATPQIIGDFAKE